MTAEEKLRELLAEAREFVALFHEAGCPDDQCEGCAAANDMTSRIDAALAEPVVDMEASASRGWQMADSLHLSVKEQRERAEKAEAERDEARAEVERLKVFASRLYAAAIPGVTFATQYEDLMIENVRDGTADRERNAYRRGAEAMREAAAQLFDGKPTVPGLATMPPYAEAIRALPVPGDKK